MPETNIAQLSAAQDKLSCTYKVTVMNSFARRLTALAASIFSLTSAPASPMLFSNGMIQYVTEIDQRTYYPSDGTRFGLVDMEGNEILPVKYANIQYFGHGLFLATDTEPKHKFYFGEKRHFFTKDGVELDYKIPANTLLLTLFTYGASAEKNAALELKTLPTDTILVAVYRDGRQTLCNKEGKVLIEPNAGKVLFISPNLAFLDKGARCSIVDLTNGKVTPTEHQYSPAKYPPPRLEQAVYPRTSIDFPANRKLKIDKNDDGSFDPVYWNEKRTYPIPIFCMLNRFLRDHDLIGMSKRDVETWLGESITSPGLISGVDSSAQDRLQKLINAPNVIMYRFRSEGCIPFFGGLKITFKDDKVAHWTFVDESKESAPITQNVLLKVGFGEQSYRLVAARIGQHPGFGEDGFPLVDLKMVSGQQNSSQH
jgi:WG containing repeat